MSSTSTPTPLQAAPTLHAAPAAPDSSPSVYKGKVVRSWAQLPDEIIRHIATHYLAALSSKAFCPAQWDPKEFWPSRLIYTALRDATEVEKLMSICAPWHVALEYHPFWQHCCSVLDPLDHLAHLGIAQPSSPAAASAKAPVIRLSPFRHFQNISTYSCYVCRLNFPYSNHGLGTARRAAFSPYLRNVPVCREHRKGTFCAICLRAAPLDDTNTMVCIAENEDEETWPGLEATCRSCRIEWLWRRASHNSNDREALGGFPHRWTKHAPDWETRQAIETFVDMGEGRITEVLSLAKDKHWLRTHTKLADMLSQAVAATKFADRAEAGYEGDGSDDDLSADEDDPELMSLTEDACGVRELAIQDWVRNRILDGHWISPADQYYRLFLPHKPFVPAEHPCPWLGATYAGAVQDGESAGDGEELVHPRPTTYDAPCPPSYELCEHVFRVYQRTMRDILLPAMSNIVRRLVMESQVDGSDPAVKASRMTLESVVKELRDQDTWSKGVNWIERKHLQLKQEQRRHRSEDDDSSSSRSEGSHTTSPVLSTTTLQTTPSPPPSAGKEDDAAPSPIAVSSPVVPVPESASTQMRTLLRPIPYVPAAIAHLPQYSMESIRLVWREACARLYQCRCTICERAMLAANVDSGRTGTSEWQAGDAAVDPSTVVPKPTEIRVEEQIVIARREEEEEEESDLDAEYDDELESEVDEGILEGRTVSPTEPGTPGPPAPRPTAPPIFRKRSHDEASEERELQQFPVSVPEREGTPPKRARLDDSATVKLPAPLVDSPPLRQRKRSSEELEDDAHRPELQSPKRVKA